MVKLGKKKFTELSELRKRKVAAVYTENDQNTENEVCNSGDEENDSKKEANDGSETGLKKQKRTLQPDSDSIESDDQPLNGSKSSTSSAPPARKNQVKKTPKVTKGKAQPEKAATGKSDNKKSTAEATPKNDKPGAEKELDGEDAGDDEGEYEVEAIVGHKSKRGESFFLVRWKGYGKDDDSWEPEAELNCDDLIAEYRKKKSPVIKKSPTAAKAVRGRGKINKKSTTDPDKEWAVERILDFVDDDEQGRLYRIRWKGFGAKEDTWEPESNLSCEGLIEKFKKDQKTQTNVDAKQLRESPKKTKRLVNETIPRSNLHNRIERSSKRAAAKNRVFYGEE